MEMPNDHLFAPFWGADGDHVVYTKRLAGGPTGLVEAQPCPPFLSKRASSTFPGNAVLVR